MPLNPKKTNYSYLSEFDKFTKADFELSIKVVQGLIDRATDDFELRKWKTRLDDLKRRMKKLK